MSLTGWVVSSGSPRAVARRLIGDAGAHRVGRRALAKKYRHECSPDLDYQLPVSGEHFAIYSGVT